jgi:hypothetical protein
MDNFFNDLSFDLDENGDLQITVDGGVNFLNKEELKTIWQRTRDLVKPKSTE